MWIATTQKKNTLGFGSSYEQQLFMNSKESTSLVIFRLLKAPPHCGEFLRFSHEKNLQWLLIRIVHVIPC
ncbi:hypothetical protein Y032_0004g1767 [Ancylostoma ceylanicum]|uniref:Uncharacterized protein n=1 Tax=Ancylostoma ceylanicum TaxID=53326 RepID=A0A016VVI4_9BILA|nr:hypothetical protein Y032_0004g1767 [Ancylostoma ceylanicum]